MESHERVTPEVKTCSKCGTGKPLDSFGTSKGKRKAECKACFSAYHREYYLRNKEKVIERTQRYKVENKEKVKEFLADWYQRNKAHVLQRSAEYRSKPEVRAHEKVRTAAYYEARKEAIQAKRKLSLLNDAERKNRWGEYAKSYYLSNKHLYMAKSAKRRARKFHATPAWADFQAIAEIYKLAKQIEMETGVKQHVDHIVPLQGRNVCGLHVANNLQVISETENLSKANKFLAG